MIFQFFHLPFHACMHAANPCRDKKEFPKVKDIQSRESLTENREKKGSLVRSTEMQMCQLIDLSSILYVPSHRY